MKIIARISLAIVLLVMAPCLANAQTPASPDSPNYATQQQLHDAVAPLQRKLRAYNGRITTLEGQQKSANAAVDTLSTTQARQGKTIDSLANQGVAQQSQIDQVGKTTSLLQKSISKIYCLVASAILILVGVVIAFFFGQKDRSKKEIVLINPDVMTLRALWKEMLEKDPKGHHRISFTARLSQNLAKGFSEGGDVAGYVAIFDPADGDFEIRRPRIYYGNDPSSMWLENVPKHAAKILGLKKHDSSLGSPTNLIEA